MNPSLIARLGLALFFALLFPIQYAAAAEFFPGSAMEFQSNLNTAAGNGQNDTIHLLPIIYGTSANSNAPFTYSPTATENFSLSILGSTAGTSVIAGNNDMDFCFTADTTSINTPNDANADIAMRGISFQVPADNECIDVKTNKADLRMEDNLFSVGYTGANFVINDGGSVTFNSNRMEEGYCSNLFCAMVTGVLNNGGDITMENNSAHGIAGGSMLFAVAGMGSIKISGNSLMHLTPVAPAMAFATTSATVEVSNNIFHGNSSDAPILAFAVFNSEVDITNNVFTDNVSRMSPVVVVATDSGTFNITNNTMSANGGDPSSFFWAPATDMAILNFYNNIFFGSVSPLVAGSDIYLDDNIGPIGPKANIFNSNFTNFFSTCEADGGCAEDITMVDNLIGANPLLADPLTGNVNLLGGSPVVGQGDPDAPALPSSDFAGNPLNNPPDMGALAAIPGLAVNPQVIDFGSLVAGVPNGRTVTLTNTLALPLAVLGMTLSDANNFSIDFDTCGSATVNIAGGTSCTIKIVFNPRMNGTLDAILTIDSNAPDTPSVVIAITGFATGVGGCALAQGSPTAGSLAFLLIPMVLMAVKLRHLQRK